MVPGSGMVPDGAGPAQTARCIPHTAPPCDPYTAEIERGPPARRPAIVACAAADAVARVGEPQ